MACCPSMRVDRERRCGRQEEDGDDDDDDDDDDDAAAAATTVKQDGVDGCGIRSFCLRLGCDGGWNLYDFLACTLHFPLV